ncbi:hypothetical protein [Leptospira venezuelensis]|nr:hypothetical protein [Leptospira venezuelensis]
MKYFLYLIWDKNIFRKNVQIDLLQTRACFSFEKNMRDFLMFKIFVSVLLVLSVSFVSTSCSDLEDLNPFDTQEDVDQKAMDNFIKLWFIVVATGQAMANNPPSWFPTSSSVEEAKAEWDALDPIKKAEACAIAFASGEKPPVELCTK